ncbi:MAG: PD40 domain-containing protein [Candidatus Latescibacteria bacterium]|nr:PD40 domain-containing protein [Candidatus Latescibacterota bacterium]
MRRIYLKLLISIVGIVVVATAVAVGRRHSEQIKQKRLNSLFLGDYKVVKVAEQGYYPGCVYDLQAYAGEPSSGIEPEVEPELPFPVKPKTWELAHVEGATPEQLEAMRRQMRVDAVTEATPPADKLRWRSAYREPIYSEQLRIAYPSQGAVFPPNLCPPCVEWEDGENNLWQVTVELTGTSLKRSFVTERKSWWFPERLWCRICKEAKSRDIWIQVKGVKRSGSYSKTPEPIQASEPVHFRISKHPVDNYVVYRLVLPQFQAKKTPDTFIRDLRSFEVKPFLLARRQYCFSCHVFSAKAGTEGMLALKMRIMDEKKSAAGLGVFNMASAKGQRLLFPFPHPGFTYVAWNSEGNKLAISANQAFSSLTPIVFEAQELEYSFSDIAVYDLSEECSFLLPGANSPDYLEIYPAWTPDGKQIVFSQAKAGVSARVIKYNIYVVDYNDGKGGKAVPVAGVSYNGKSNYYARFSPDGKWMSLCMADQGSLIESSSDIYLLSASLEGQAHRLECNADYAADSWHSWSSNSRWLVFATKRDDGVFARFYLTQIDDKGHASPAVRMPLKDPTLASFNIPEFLAQMPRFSERQLFDVVSAQNPTVTVKERELR